jgi:hypothetical protein
MHINNEPIISTIKQSPTYWLLSPDSSLSSFMTLCTLFFAITLALHISFIAKNSPLIFFPSTRQTFPKPPRPIG